MQVDVPIQLPSQLEDEIRKTIASVIIEGAKQATNLYYDLPPYPFQSTHSCRVRRDHRGI